MGLETEPIVRQGSTKFGEDAAMPVAVIATLCRTKWQIGQSASDGIGSDSLECELEAKSEEDCDVEGSAWL
jgi:hypothetical protein